MAPPTAPPGVEPVTVHEILPADLRNVGHARRLLRGALERSGAEDLTDAATLALSELVTNAFVHVGGEVVVKISATADAVRAEVEDGAAHLPSRRSHAATAGTGRGLQLVEELSDRWGATVRAGGKVVWFEIGHQPAPDGAAVALDPDAPDAPDAADAAVQVTLRQVPVLMHAAWQEHAASLLREYLLHVLGEDDDILDKHAQASEAMGLLHDQLPRPSLPEGADALMAGAVEPQVTADEVVLHVPVATVPHFRVLDELLQCAVVEARLGRFLSPPTQPEIEEMRRWVCTEIAQQAGGDTVAIPWMARTDVRATVADQAALLARYSHLAETDEALLATDEASVVVAVSPAALRILGHRHADELVGRRVLVVVPARFHQAHIAGTTLHATNGRDNLLDVPVDVPMVRADGTEVAVRLVVRVERLADESRVSVARFAVSDGL